ncbi:hypothetical protein BKA57DRAFT_469588 [Linnemannia elongata]|nr:hypothetical protein BKA57DRAFT_469588 [Linnemannia elongata]
MAITGQAHSDTIVSDILSAMPPDLVLIVGQYFDQRDLYSCIQVSRSWNEMLIPQLWRSIRTESGGWWKLFGEYGSQTESEPKVELEEWIRMIFEKYGHHIRHLETQSFLALGAASLSSSCRNLLSLSVPHIEYHDSQVLSIPRPPVTTTPATLAVAATFEPPILPWTSSFSTAEWDRRVGYTHVFEPIWVLIRQNLGLRRLAFPYEPTLKDLPQTFVISTLSSLKHLKALDLEYNSLEGNAFQSAVPNLERLRTYNPENLSSLQKNYSSLRSLKIPKVMRVDTLLAVMDRLPGLEELGVLQISSYGVISTTAVTAGLLTSFPSLRVLTINMVGKEDDQAIAVLVIRLPGLVRVRMPRILQNTKKALWNTCYHLDDIGSYTHDTYETWAIYWRKRRAKGANTQGKEREE